MKKAVRKKAMASVESAGVESQIARWVAGFSVSETPGSILDVARLCIADGLGVMLAGTRTLVFAQCMGLARPAGNCAIAGTDVQADVCSAAFLGSVACHALDFDDTCYAGIVHGTAVVLPAVLAVGQDVNADGRRLLEAYLVGVETEYALGLALTDSLYQRGFWTTATLGVFGAAAAAAKLLDLGPCAIVDAIRLAANMPLGLRVTHGSNGKPYLCGMAARLGVEAAYAARAGIRGQPRTIESSRGYAAAVNAGFLDPAALDRLGRRYALIDPGIAFKLRPICSAAQAAVEATVILQALHDFDASEVESVLCRGNPLVVTSLPYRHPLLPSEAQFSMPFAIACTLLHGDVRPAHLSPETLSDPSLAEVMDRVDLVEDESFVPENARNACPEPAQVRITLRDGRCLEATVLAATGMPQQPATATQLFDKFMRCATPVLTAREAKALWERAGRIETLANVRELFG